MQDSQYYKNSTIPFGDVLELRTLLGRCDEQRVIVFGSLAPGTI